MRKAIPIIVVVLLLACVVLTVPSGNSCATSGVACKKTATATTAPATSTVEPTVTSTLWTPQPTWTARPPQPTCTPPPKEGETGELCCVPYDTVCEPFESGAFIEHYGGDTDLLERHRITDITPGDVKANQHCRKLKPGRYIAAFWSGSNGGHANLQPREVTVYEGQTTWAFQPNSPYTK